MPNTAGTSFIGAQLLNSLPTGTNRFVNIYFPTFDTRERFIRVGTLLVCFRLSNQQFPVSYVSKLYGAGIAENLTNELPAVVEEVWVRWFQAGISWQCQTP